MSNSTSIFDHQCMFNYTTSRDMFYIYDESRDDNPKPQKYCNPVKYNTDRYNECYDDVSYNTQSKND